VGIGVTVIWIEIDNLKNSMAGRKGKMSEEGMGVRCEV
jgi:hypothetical protein